MQNIFCTSMRTTPAMVFLRRLLQRKQVDSSIFKKNEARVPYVQLVFELADSGSTCLDTNRAMDLLASMSNKYVETVADLFPVDADHPDLLPCLRNFCGKLVVWNRRTLYSSDSVECWSIHYTSCGGRVASSGTTRSWTISTCPPSLRVLKTCHLGLKSMGRVALLYLPRVMKNML